MKAFPSRFYGLRYWLVIPSIFFSGILFGLYIGHQYDKFIPVIYSVDSSQMNSLSSGIIPDPQGLNKTVVVSTGQNKSIRVVCMIMTMPDNHEKKVMAVVKTWAPRCDVYYFLSSVEDKSLHALVAVTSEGRDKLWDKTKFGLRHAMEHYSDYDFFIKADDDTYIIMENLHLLLKDHDPEVPIIMGRRWRPHVKQGYLSGGGGYVMSRAALKLIVAGLQNNPDCAGSQTGGAEDVRLGKCAEVTGVKLVDSLDDQGYERFHPFNAIGMINHVSGENPKWYKSYNYHKILTGYRCCSNRSVTFHYVSPDDMYLYDFFIYHLRLRSR